MKAQGSIILLIAFLSCMPAGAAADVVFDSNFTGPNGAQISSLPEWADASITGSTRKLDNNKGKFNMNRAGWIYSSIRANTAFYPTVGTDGLRFEYTVTAMTDTVTSGSSTYNVGNFLCLANASTWNGYSRNMNGEKLIWGLLWYKSTNNIDISFTIANRDGQSNDTGVAAYANAVPNVDMDGGDMIKLAMEIRDDADGNDVRVGYQIYDATTSLWSDWVYSQWFDPTDEDGSLGLDDDTNNLSAFGADWKTRWGLSTYFYIEACCPDNRQGNVWVDDAVVTGSIATSPNMPQIYLNISGADAAQISQALEDFKRCFYEITGVSAPEVPLPGLKPLRVRFVSTGENSSNPDPLGIQDYEIKIDSNEILFSAVTALGLSNAFYDILDQWGCRWIVPDANIGEVIPEGAFLNLQNGTFRKHISMDSRVVGGDSLWLARNRMGRTHWLSGTHYWLTAINPDVYFEAHPEYYSLVGGQRVAKQLCTTNQNVINLMIQKAKERLAADTALDSFPIEPEDNIDFCQCENCKALDPTGYMSNGCKSITNRVVTFANAVAAGIENDYPDKMAAYDAYLTHQDTPVGVTVHPKTLVQVCRDFGCSIHLSPTPDCNGSMQFWNNLDAWLGVCPNVYVYEYLPVALSGSLPCPLYIEAGRSIKELHQRGVKGILEDVGGEYCNSTNFPLYYVMLKMKADASLDPNAVLEDMCHSFFGSAGDVMNDYYKTLAHITDCTHSTRSRIAWTAWGYEEMFTPQMITTARQYINQAVTLTSGDPVLSQRVAMVERGQDYLEDYLAGMWAAQGDNYSGCTRAFAEADADIDVLIAAGENVDTAKQKMFQAKMKSIAKYMPDELGFIRTWLLLGPIDNDNCDAHWYAEMFPSEMFPEGVSIGSPAKMYDDTKVYWDEYTSTEGQIDFTQAFTSPSWRFSSAYAVVKVNMPTAMTVQLRCASACPFRLYVNGIEAYQQLGGKSDYPDQRIVTTSLLAGDNRIVWKISQTFPPDYTQRWGFFFRITNTSGNLISGLTTSTDLVIPEPTPYDCEDIWYYGYGRKTDFNKDCRVNLLDFSYLALKWLQCNNPVDPNC